MQWMTVTSFVPCHALHVPQHVAVSLSELLNQVISSDLNNTHDNNNQVQNN